MAREREREEGLTPVMQIHSCAVSSEGGVKCWGFGYRGQVMFLASAIRFEVRARVCAAARMFILILSRLRYKCQYY